MVRELRFRLELAWLRLLIEELFDREFCLVPLSCLQVIHPIRHIRHDLTGRGAFGFYRGLHLGFDVVLLYDFDLCSFLHYCFLLVRV